MVLSSIGSLNLITMGDEVGLPSASFTGIVDSTVGAVVSPNMFNCSSIVWKISPLDTFTTSLLSELSLVAGIVSVRVVLESGMTASG